MIKICTNYAACNFISGDGNRGVKIEVMGHDTGGNYCRITYFDYVAINKIKAMQELRKICKAIDFGDIKNSIGDMKILSIKKEQGGIQKW